MNKGITTYSNPLMNFRKLKDSAIDWIYKLHYLPFSEKWWVELITRRVLKSLTANCKAKANANVYWSKQNFNLKHLFIWQTLTHQSSVISQDHLLFFKLSPVLVPIGHNWNRKYQQNMSVVVVPSGNRERGTLGDWTLNISKKGKDCISS